MKGREARIQWQTNVLCRNSLFLTWWTAMGLIGLARKVVFTTT